MRLSRVLKPNDVKYQDEAIPTRRKAVWVVVWIGILVGIVMYFKYARLLTPMLG
jgi:hypothetical protein